LWCFLAWCFLACFFPPFDGFGDFPDDGFGADADDEFGLAADDDGLAAEVDDGLAAETDDGLAAEVDGLAADGAADLCCLVGLVASFLAGLVSLVGFSFLVTTLCDGSAVFEAFFETLASFLSCLAAETTAKRTMQMSANKKSFLIFCL